MASVHQLCRPEVPLNQLLLNQLMPGRSSCHVKLCPRHTLLQQGLDNLIVPCLASCKEGTVEVFHRLSQVTTMRFKLPQASFEIHEIVHAFLVVLIWLKLNVSSKPCEERQVRCQDSV